MKKTDYPSLLPRGLKTTDLAGVFDIAVRPFLPDARREDLWERFRRLVARLGADGLHGVKMWIGGSFLTQHRTPGDVDAVVWLSDESIDALPNAGYDDLSELRIRAAVLHMYGVDLYFVPPDEENFTYWDKTLGMCHDGVTPKGYLEIVL